MQYLKQSLFSLAVCVALFAGINFVIANGYSWKTPSQEGYSIQNNTPTGNVATPVNVGTTGQYKSGGLYLGTGLSAGQFGLVVKRGVRFEDFPACNNLGTDVSGNVVCKEQGCIPSCAGKVCGDNGCGGSCGNCTSPATCVNFQCVTPCTPTGCNGRCGSVGDGCGGTINCGACDQIYYSPTCSLGTTISQNQAAINAFCVEQGWSYAVCDRVDTSHNTVDGKVCNYSGGWYLQSVPWPYYMCGWLHCYK